MWYLWAVPIVLVVFLWALNEHLSGHLKDVTSGVLIWTVVGLIVAAFIVSGWKAGALSLVLVPISALVVIPVARSVARLSHGYSDLRIEAHRRRQMDGLRNASQAIDPFDVMETQASSDRKHMEATVGRAVAQPPIQKVLAEHACARRDLEALYRRVEVQMIPPELREIALGNPALLGFFLDNSGPSTVDGEYRREVIDLNTHMVLSLWVSHDPAAAMPPQDCA